MNRKDREEQKQRRISEKNGTKIKGKKKNQRKENSEEKEKYRKRKTTEEDTVTEDNGGIEEEGRLKKMTRWTQKVKIMIYICKKHKRKLLPFHISKYFIRHGENISNGIPFSNRSIISVMFIILLPSL